MVMLLAAGLAALGIYGDLTGPAGRWFGRLSGDAVGIGRFGVPPALAVIGVGLVRTRTSWRSRSARSAIASLMILGSFCGLMQLARGPKHLKHLHDHFGGLRAAGGLLGAAIGVPLRSVLALWGTSLVLVTLALAGFLVITSTSVHQASRWIEDAGSSLKRQLVDLSEAVAEALEDRRRRRIELASQRELGHRGDPGHGEWPDSAEPDSPSRRVFDFDDHDRYRSDLDDDDDDDDLRHGV
jgi:S-DNA-T family DNA segregation ATPase FtsK/SpoIIIE